MRLHSNTHDPSTSEATGRGIGIASLYFDPLRASLYVHTTPRCFAYPNPKYAILASSSKTTLQG